MEPSAQEVDEAAFWRERRSRHPPLLEALAADVRMTAEHRGEARELRSALAYAREAVRLAWVSDGFLAQALYRLKASGQARGVPLLPRIAHRLAMAVAQTAIGDPVVVGAGVYVVHGQVVIDGISEVGSGAVIAPWVTIGLRAGVLEGPTIGPGVSIGTGAKVIGPVHVGAGASIGANAVVVDDVPPGVTVVGAPARPVASAGGRAAEVVG